MQEQAGYGANWAIPPDGGWIRNQKADGENIDLADAMEQREKDNKDIPQDVTLDPSMNVSCHESCHSPSVSSIRAMTRRYMV